MKMKSFLLAPVIALLAFTTPALADNDNAPHQNQSGQPGVRNPEKHENGERGEPSHRINEFGEGGFEAIQFVLIGGAIVVALLLAYHAGKRNRKKNDQE